MDVPDRFADLPRLDGRIADGGGRDWQWPYPGYAALRESGGNLWLADLDHEVVVLDHAEAWRVLRDPAWSSSPAWAREGNLEGGPELRARAADVGASILLFMDPPDHTRLRRLVSHAFTPRRIEQLRTHVRDLADGFVDAAVERGHLEVVGELGYLLPVTVICELLGVPTSDRDRFAPWSAAATRLLDGDLDEATMDTGLLAVAELAQYLTDLFEARRAEPADDLISALLAVEEEGDRLTESELMSVVILLFLAGHETTQNLIGNGVWALLRHPDQWRRLVEDPSLVPAAVEEVLRWDGPVHVTGRFATRDGLRVAGREVAAGDQVVTLLAACNRDPAVFDRPEEFLVDRDGPAHLTFSQGAHYCLGANLARLEGQEVLSCLVERLPGLSPEWVRDEPRYRDHFVLRGLEALHLDLC